MLKITSRFLLIFCSVFDSQSIPALDTICRVKTKALQNTASTHSERFHTQSYTSAVLLREPQPFDVIHDKKIFLLLYIVVPPSAHHLTYCYILQAYAGWSKGAGLCLHMHACTCKKNHVKHFSTIRSVQKLVYTKVRMRNLLDNIRFGVSFRVVNISGFRRSCLSFCTCLQQGCS